MVDICGINVTLIGIIRHTISKNVILRRSLISYKTVSGLFYEVSVSIWLSCLSCVTSSRSPQRYERTSSWDAENVCVSSH